MELPASKDIQETVGAELASIDPNLVGVSPDLPAQRLQNLVGIVGLAERQRNALNQRIESHHLGGREADVPGVGREPGYANCRSDVVPYVLMKNAPMSTIVGKAEVVDNGG